MAKLLFKYPTRSRPRLFAETLHTWRSLLSGKHHYKWLISMDTNDNTMNVERIKDMLNRFEDTDYYYGNSTSKIMAVNADLDKCPLFDILILVSDDQIPVVPGFDDHLVNEMVDAFPNLDGCIWHYDNRTKDICTLPIMGSTYFHKYGYIYNTAYQSLWADNEMTVVAQNAGKIKYYDQVLIEHRWRDVIGNDHLMTHNESFYQQDSIVFQQRKAAGFGENNGK